MSSNSIAPELTKLRLKDNEVVEFVELEFYQRADKRFKEILQAERADYASYLEKGKLVAKRVVDLLRTKLRVERHFVSVHVGRRASSSSDQISTPFTLHLVFKVIDTTDFSASKMDKIRNSLYFILSPYSALYNVERPGMFSSFLQVTDIKTGFQFCIFVVYDTLTDAEWDEAEVVFTKWPFSSLFLKSMVSPYYISETCEYLSAIDQFTRDVISLAKIWKANCSGSSSENSTIVELIAISVADQETKENKTFRTMTSALERFLEDVMRTASRKARLPPWHNIPAIDEYESMKDPIKQINYSFMGFSRDNLCTEAKRCLASMKDIECGTKPADCLIGFKF